MLRCNEQASGDTFVVIESVDGRALPSKPQIAQVLTRFSGVRVFSHRGTQVQLSAVRTVNESDRIELVKSIEAIMP